MVKKIFSYSVFMLLAGILISGCSSTNKYVKDAKSQLQESNYEAALKSAQESINNYPEDPLGYYYQAVAYGDMAEDKEDPAERQEVYKKMNASLEKAKELASQMEEPPSDLENLDVVKIALWSSEHNRAIELATSDSLQQAIPNATEQAVEHLHNATTIIPDSTLSWDILATVQASMNNNLEAAIEAKQKSMSLKEPPRAQDYEVLSDYYRLNQNYDASIKILNKARETYPDSVGIIRKLADSYMNKEEYEKSISMIEQLLEKEPDNPQYHLSLGTQIYQTVLELNDSLSTNYDQIFELQQKLDEGTGNTSELKEQISTLQEANAQVEKRVNNLTERAINELNTVLEYRPEDPIANHTLGVIYQNKASTLHQQRGQTMDNEEAEALTKEADKYLNQALKYYEKATEIDPDNKNYWESLFKVYVNLGMDEKAKEAAEKAGI